MIFCIIFIKTSAQYKEPQYNAEITIKSTTFFETQSFMLLAQQSSAE